MSGRYIFKFATKKAGCKGPDIYNGDVIWDESDGPVHLKFWSGNEYVRLSDMVRNEVDKYMKETNRMIDRPTPETDGAERMAFAQEYMVPTDFARKLERERDSARELAQAFHNDQARELCRELADLVAYGLGQSGEPWSLEAMRQATKAIQNAKQIVAV